jgi:outer membrane receptor protein involved in Fe transport
VGDLLPLFIPKTAPLSFSSAPAFYDYQFLATYAPDERDKLRIIWNGSQDKLVALLTRPAGDPTISGSLQTRVAFHDLSASWTRVLSPRLRQESSLTAGLQDFTFEIGPELYFRLGSQRLDGRTSWSWQALPQLEARAGLDLQYAHYDISLDLPRPPQEGQPGSPVSTSQRVVARQEGSLWSPAAFAELRFTPVEGAALLPSARIDYSSAIDRWSVDPRLMARWQVAAGTVLKAAVGVYQQPPAPQQSARDIGNPDLLPERSLQYSAGVEWRVAEGIDLDAGPFYKDLSRMVVSNPQANVNPAAPPYRNDGTGRVYGLELLLRARFGEKFFGWVAYTFQRSLRTDHPGDPERRFSYDQPHILTALGSWRLSSAWTLGARFRLVSGNPYTPVVGSIYYSATDVHVPIYGPVNSGRLDAFHALDLRADRTWTYDRWKLSAYLDVQNVYNHASQEGVRYAYDFRQKQALTGLPILPIAGVKAEW